MYNLIEWLKINKSNILLHILWVIIHILCVFSLIYLLYYVSNMDKTEDDIEKNSSEEVEQRIDELIYTFDYVETIEIVETEESVETEDIEEVETTNTPKVEAIEDESDVEEVIEEKDKINKYKTFESTFYTAFCEGCNGITYTGVNVSNTTHYKGMRVVAVDPNVIPIGATLEVVVNDEWTFTGTAQDIGGAIKGNIIDILVTDRDKALRLGRQEVKIKILEGE